MLLQPHTLRADEPKIFVVADGVGRRADRFDKFTDSHSGTTSWVRVDHGLNPMSTGAAR